MKVKDIQTIISESMTINFEISDGSQWKMDAPNMNSRKLHQIHFYSQNNSFYILTEKDGLYSISNPPH
jgi:hypothetical protein